MLPLELLWVTLALLIIRASCSNDFVTSDFPSEFALDNKTEFYWKNLKGYIAGIRVHASGEDDDSDSNWILEPNCSDDDDDDDSSCTAYANNGSAYFSGSYANGTKATLGSGYELRLLWTDSEDYDDIDDDTSQVSSPSFSIVQGTSEEVESGMSKGEKAGIAVAVIVVIFILILVLWWWLRKERKKRRRRRRRKEERDSEKGNGDERWSTTATSGFGKNEGTWTSFFAAVALPEKPAPTASRGRRSGSGDSGGSGGRGQLYLDNKAELPADAGDQHKLGLGGATAASTRTAPKRAASAPTAPVELPAEPVREQDPALRPGTRTTTFVYNPRPSYALQTSSAPGPGPTFPSSPVSPVSPAAVGPVDGSVSPVSPISRKPVGNTVEAAPMEQWHGGGSEIKIIVTDTAQVAHDGGRL